MTKVRKVYDNVALGIQVKTDVYKKLDAISKQTRLTKTQIMHLAIERFAKDFFANPGIFGVDELEKV